MESKTIATGQSVGQASAVLIKSVVDDVFVFGPYRLIPRQKLLLRGNRPIRLGGRALDVLHLLVMRAGDELSKEALIRFVWPDVSVDERNLKVQVSKLRQILQDTLPQATYIATVAGRGYQFVGRVETERVQTADFSGVERFGASGLPASPTLVGRLREVEEVSRALEPGTVVTLVGPGGVGKTSIAVAVAHARRDAFPDGVHFVDLSTTQDPGLVPHLIARELGIRGEQADLASVVVGHLRDRRALIILDNCEHLLHSIAAIATRLAVAETDSCVLATSREPLGIGAEVQRRVEPLGFPSGSKVRGMNEALAYPSLELFALRALEATAYRLVDDDVPAVASLCAALDGLPLAIEIAAAKLGEFSPAELLVSVGPRLAALQNDHEGAHARHRTLWAMLDWSYKLLSSEEATVFRLLSVFAGSFEWAEGAGMGRLVEYDPYVITLALGGLVSKSLLSVATVGDQLRYRLLENAKCYATGSLLRDPLARVAQLHHAQLVLATFERSEAEWGNVENDVWRSRYDGQAADLRKALDWCFAPEGDVTLGVDLAIAAIRFWNENSFMSEQRFQVDRALMHCSSMAQSPRREAILATSRAWSMVFARRSQSDTDDAWRSALERAERGGDLGQRLSARSGWAHHLIYTGRNEEAVELLDEFTRIAARAGDRGSVFDGQRLSALAEMHLGKLAYVVKKLERLAEALSRGVPPSRVTRYQEQRGVSIDGTLAFANWLVGRSAPALASAEAVVLQTGRVGLLMGQSHTLALVALPMSLWSGRFDLVERYATILESNLERENIAMYRPVQRFYAASARQARGEPDALDDMRAAVDELVRDGFLVRTPMYFGVLADALLDDGRCPEAVDAIEVGLALQRRSKENWCVAELLRVKGRTLAATGEGDLARATLGEASERALAIGARIFALRAANELARLAPTARQGEAGTVSPRRARSRTSDRGRTARA